ncbi:UNVERIFIED_CONTAM: hypothetical protein NCL1_37562 [Trichonephila clavipes]
MIPEELNMKKVVCLWVPHNLTEQKNRSVSESKYRMDQIQQVGRAEDSDSKLVYHLMSSRNSPRT